MEPVRRLLGDPIVVPQYPEMEATTYADAPAPLGLGQSDLIVQAVLP